MAYGIELGDSATGNVTRIDNALAKLPEHLEEYQAKLADLKQQMESARAEAAKPFLPSASRTRCHDGDGGKRHRKKFLPIS